MKAQERLLATARAGLGYLEKATNAQLDDKTANAGSNNWTKFARDLDNLGDVFNGKKNGYDWCGVFATWCFVRTFAATESEENHAGIFAGHTSGRDHSGGSRADRVSCCVHPQGG